MSKSGAEEGEAEVKSRVKKQFGAAAAAYVVSDVHALGESLGVLVDAVCPEESWRALDVATGAGHTAIAMAPRVAHVIASDLTDEMLATAARLARERSISNLDTRSADAEALPFEDESFDLVTCRLAFHHFPNPARAVVEMVRVLKPGGTLGFTDNVVVEDSASRAAYNAYEKLRDPSHVEVLPLAELVDLFENAGLRVMLTRGLSKEFEFHDWADRQRVSADDKQTLLGMLRTLPAPLEPLLRPRFSNGTAYFSLWEAVVVATKLQ